MSSKVFYMVNGLPIFTGVETGRNLWKKISYIFFMDELKVANYDQSCHDLKHTKIRGC